MGRAVRLSVTSVLGGLVSLQRKSLTVPFGVDLLITKQDLKYPIVKKLKRIIYCMRFVTSNNRVRFSPACLIGTQARIAAGLFAIVFSVFCALTTCPEETSIYLPLMCCKGGQNLTLFPFGNTVVVEGLR